MVVEIICTIAGVSPLGWSDGPGPKAPRGVVVLDEPAVIGQPWRVARPPAPGAGRPRHHVGRMGGHACAQWIATRPQSWRLSAIRFSLRS
jgi:hypothetical protein